MAVYQKTYRRYEGGLTPRWSRFAVLARYASGAAFGSRWVTGLFALSFAVPLGAAVIIYLHHNIGALQVLELQTSDLISINASFFFRVLAMQGFSAFLLTAMIGPGLISPDLANQALPLYLSRPLTRAEYVAGKMTVLFGVLSLVTWIPLLLLVGLQAQLAEGWLAANWRIAGAVLAGGLVWVLFLSLLALSFSAWVRWKTVAAGALFAVFFVGPGLAGIVNGMLDTRWGSVFDLRAIIRTVWDGLFFGEAVEMSLGVAWLALLAWSGLCLYMLHRKVRAYEVVR